MACDGSSRIFRFWNRNSARGALRRWLAFTAGTGKQYLVYPNAPTGLTFPGDAGFPGRSYNAGKLNQLAPRIGVMCMTPGE